MANGVDQRERLRKIRSFPELVTYLREDLDWPIAQADFEELTYEYEAEELGIDPKNAAKIRKIRRLRPLHANQPWGIFFIDFEPKRLPVVALRRILNSVVVKKRASAQSSERRYWDTEDMLFVSNYGEVGEGRQITFVHFQRKPDALAPTVNVLGWDSRDTPLHLDDVADKLEHYLAWPKDVKNADLWRKTWMQAFQLQHGEVIRTSQELATALAKLARSIRDRILSTLAVESEKGPIRTLMNAFREALVHDLKDKDFADMYAQTIAYGLLSARIANRKNPNANRLSLPVTNPFLKELMEAFLKTGERSSRGKPGIDFDELGVGEVVELLDRANLEAVVRDFGDQKPGEDPVIHFYEDFLSEYDKRLKIQRGVFYTPRPVVSFIVRSVHELLRRDFGLPDGLADTSTWNDVVARVPGIALPKRTGKAGETRTISPDEPFVQVLDPATGTGTFLVEVIEVIHQTLTAKWLAQGLSKTQRDAAWNGYVPKSLLPRLHAFEFMMAPYAIAHLKVGLKLAETGYRFESSERARVYLTNALEPALDQVPLVGFEALAHEASAVNEIKREKKFTVILGNPPYSKMSSNLGYEAVALVEPFRFAEGMRIVERGALALELNLQDDYVKFWGLACALNDRATAGIVALITNSRYLASPTLRGLRSHLAGQFSSAFFFDLGGQVSERATIEGPDENVFDIEQGVAIGILAKRPSSSRLTTVQHLRIVGTREAKSSKLLESSATSLQTETVENVPPQFRFSRGVDEAERESQAWPKLDEIMPFNSGSIITSRDNLAIDVVADDLVAKATRFANSRRGDTSIQEEIGFSAKEKWDVEACKLEIRHLRDVRAPLREILYRPFDRRWIYYLPSLLDTPSRPVCESVFGRENLVLLSPSVKTTSAFSHALVSSEPAEKKACSHDRATQMFPLYDYRTGKRPNIAPAFRGDRNEREVFAYLYAILYSNGYRTRYGQAVRDGYARVPPPPLGPLFTTLAKLGLALIDAHLLRSGSTAGRIVGSAPHTVERIAFSDQTIWIDADESRGFGDVPEAVWQYEIGGYQVWRWCKTPSSAAGNDPRPNSVQPGVWKPRR